MEIFDNRPSSPQKSPPKRGMDAESHPAFSDFSHMGPNNLGFAVGLREDNPELILQKVAPLSFIKPGIPKEKKKKERVEEIAECTNRACVERKVKVEELTQGNYDLKEKLKTAESRLAGVKGQCELAKKTIIIIEEKNISLRQQIEDTEQRIQSAETNLANGEDINRKLKDELELILQEIEELKHIRQQNEKKDNKNDDDTVVSMPVPKVTVNANMKVKFCRPNKKKTPESIKYENEITRLASTIKNNIDNDESSDDD